MDLMLSYKNSNSLIWIILWMSVLCSVAHSWRISQKCPHGHYYSDGCTACWCDIRSGVTKCERLLQCRRTNNEMVNCPRGRLYKDSCGNDCTCYESTGAVFCNEKRKCPPVLRSDMQNNEFQKRGGLAVAAGANDDSFNLKFGFSSTPTPTNFLRTRTDNFHNGFSSTPRPTSFLNLHTDTLHSGFSSTPRPTSFLNLHTVTGKPYDQVSMSSTPHPHLRIPNRSEELIIEPAIIIRKKGSNKASVVRNPSSATAVTLSSRRGHDPSLITSAGGTHSTILLSPHDKPSNPYQSSSARQFAPLHLYQKQLKTFMDIKRAYTQLLRSKVNVNLKLGSSQNVNSNLPFNRIVVLGENNMTPSSSTEHPRRFDSESGNLTLMSSTPSSIFGLHQQSKPPLKPYQVFLRRPELIRNEIKSALKNFSPVPKLTNLVNYVTTSTESYLSSFLNPMNKQSQQQQQSEHINSFQILKQPTYETTTNPPTLPSIPFTYATRNGPYQTMTPTTSQEPYHELVNQFDPSNIPIHQIYQNHDYSAYLTTTPAPPPATSPSYQNNFNQQNFRFPSYYSNQFDKKKLNTPHNQFPYMTELMNEIARSDHFAPPPRSTPRSSPELTATPTFQTPGPPYAEVDVVQPLSFLPPPIPEPATPTRKSFNVRRPPPPPPPSRYLPRQNVRVNLDKPIFLSKSPPPNRRQYFVNRPPPPFQTHRQFIIPKPKQYRLVLKGGIRDHAVRVDDAVPRFVSRIAHEFFKKPEIYVPKIRPGKPLTLEKVVLNHKELVPKQVFFHPGGTSTKLRFTPQAQWEMKSDLAKHGIMLDEPLTSIRDYAKNDQNIMHMDSPIRADLTDETHSHMPMGNYPEYSSNSGINNGVNPTTFNDKIQHSYSQPKPTQYPILLPSPTPTNFHIQSLDRQHQQELQHQLLLAQQQANAAPSTSASNTGFTFDPGEMDDFKEDNADILPKELQIPGVQQVIVDKYVVHDPMNPNSPVVFSTTTVQPPTNRNDDFSSVNYHRNGAAAVSPQNNYGPTPPSVLIRHHGAPSPSTSTTPSSVFHSAFANNPNVLVTVINSTPSPFVTSTAAPQFQIMQPPTPGNGGSNSNIISQIQSMFSDQMDFGAKSHLDLFDMLFQPRAGVPNNPNTPSVPEEEKETAEVEDQIANETKPGEVDIDPLANIFSMDYKQKHGKKPPEVIVIKVPEGHSDGPFPKVVEKRRGQEIEIIGGSNRNPTKPRDDDEDVQPSTENSIITTTLRSVDSKESNESSTETTTKRGRKRKKNKKRRRKKKRKNRNRDNRPNDDEEQEEEEVENSDSKLNSQDNSQEKKDEEINENDNSSTEASKDDTIQKGNEAEEKFQAELSWKSKLMANICELNPSLPDLSEHLSSHDFRRRLKEGLHPPN